MLSLCGAMMMRAKQGRIINITSVSAFTGNYGQINYTAAKAGMVGMTKPPPRSWVRAALR